MQKLAEKILPGVSLSKGSAIGPLFFLQLDERKVSGFSINHNEVDGEIARYRQALFSSRQDLHQLKDHLASSQEVATIIDTHLSMLEDPLMTEQMEDQIRSSLKTPESVFQSVIGAYQKRFSKQTNPFFQERLNDVADLAHRVLGHLCSQSEAEWSNIPCGAIVVALELTPLQIATLAALPVAGVVTTRGGRQSHAALIAKAKNLPYLAGIDIEICRRDLGEQAIVDATRGQLILNPEKSTIHRYQQALQTELPAASSSYTSDGKEIHCYVNISDPSEYLQQQGDSGVGLFRTEALLLENPLLAFSEEKQRALYEPLLQKTSSSSCVIRLFDIGADKIPVGWEEKQVESLFGLRGIRFLLHHPQILMTQMKALVFRYPVKILLPFVADVSEIIAFKELVKPLSLPAFSLGAMIELPSAALAIEAILDEVDFVSIGTNDLTQYTLGIDRTQETLLPFPSALHPSILYLIRFVIQKAGEKNKKVSLCGDMGSDPSYIPLLLGMGLRHISVSSDALSAVKKTICSTSLQSAEILADKICSCKRAEQVVERLCSQ